MKVILILFLRPLSLVPLRLFPIIFTKGCNAPTPRCAIYSRDFYYTHDAFVSLAQRKRIGPESASNSKHRGARTLRVEKLTSRVSVDVNVRTTRVVRQKEIAVLLLVSLIKIIMKLRVLYK